MSPSPRTVSNKEVTVNATFSRLLAASSIIILFVGCTSMNTSYNPDSSRSCMLRDYKIESLPDAGVLHSGSVDRFPVARVAGLDLSNAYQFNDIAAVPLAYEIIPEYRAFASEIAADEIDTKIKVSIPHSFSGIGPCGVFSSEAECIYILNRVSWTFFSINTELGLRSYLLTTSKLSPRGA